MRHDLYLRFELPYHPTRTSDPSYLIFSWWRHPLLPFSGFDLSLVVALLTAFSLPSSSSFLPNGADSPFASIPPLPKPTAHIHDAECQEGRFDLETATRKNSGCTNASETICTTKAKLMETRKRPVGRKGSFVRETSDLGSGSLWS